MQTKTIIPKIIEKIKKNDSKIYYEPFVGGGSIIIELLKQVHKNNIKNVSFYCSDINENLIRMYNEIKSNCSELIEKLKKYLDKDNEKDYNHIRKEFNENPCTEQFIYLNKRCFRGLYRVNKKGMFNSSYNKMKNPPLFDENNLLQLSSIFNEYDVKFECIDFFRINFQNCSTYFDPPYFKAFNDYSSNVFDHSEYVKRLRELNSRNDVHLIHSNSNEFQTIYSDQTPIIVNVQERMNCQKQNSRRFELLFS